MKHAILTMLATYFLVVTATSGQTEHQLQQAKQDSQVMAKIIETTLQNQSLTQLSVTSRYLAKQGFLFEIDHSYHFSNFEIPVAPAVIDEIKLQQFEQMAESFADWGDEFANWEDDIEEETERAIEEQLTAIDKEVALSEQQLHDTPTDSSATQDQNNQYAAKIEQLNQKKQSLLRQQRQHEQQLEKELKQLMQQKQKQAYQQQQQQVEALQQARDQIRQQREQVIKEKMQLKKEYYQTRIRQKKQQYQQHIKTVLTSFCQYSSTLRSLEKDEYVTFIFNGFVIKTDKNTSEKDKVYIFNAQQVEKCRSDGDNLSQIMSKLTHYSL